MLTTNTTQSKIEKENKEIKVFQPSLSSSTSTDPSLSKKNEWDPFHTNLDPTSFFRTPSLDLFNPKTKLNNGSSDIKDKESNDINNSINNKLNNYQYQAPPTYPSYDSLPSNFKSKDMLAFEEDLINSLDRLGLDDDDESGNTNNKNGKNGKKNNSPESAQNDENRNKSVTLFKTEMCTTFLNTGHCRYNQKCRFAHGVADLRTVNRHPKYKTQLCKNYYETGSCPYGKRCCYLHQSPSELFASNANALSMNPYSPYPNSFSMPPLDPSLDSIHMYNPSLNMFGNTNTNNVSNNSKNSSLNLINPMEYEPLSILASPPQPRFSLSHMNLNNNNNNNIFN